MNLRRRVERACWESAQEGRIDLTADWNELVLPPIKLPNGVEGKLILSRESSSEYAKTSGYAINGEWISFVAPLAATDEKLYLAGEFNGWGAAIGQKAWEMVASDTPGWAILTVRRDLLGDKRLFKFVNSREIWQEPSFSATNVLYHEGARNYGIDYSRTGAHVFHFEIDGMADWRGVNELVWREERNFAVEEEIIPLWPGRNFYELKSELPQGAIIEGERTRFRLFAPRALKVTLVYFATDIGEKRVQLDPENDGGWSVLIPQNLEGVSYYYNVEGPSWPHTSFEAARRIIDPWAFAVRDGVGVVVDRKKFAQHAPKSFRTPAIENLVICEAHVRDLLAKAPLPLSDDERRGYRGVTKLLEWAENPFTTTGVNAVELQPLMEFDGTPKEYHWGYMPINFFAPASAYAGNPAGVSQLEELPAMVEAFHKKNIAVILDVVVNHFGVPASPMFVDKAYYFRLNSEGGLTNWSGCGNDFRVESAMAERMTLEALEHWVKNFGIDGFRFDLAELLGVPFLKKAQARLQKIKPDIILIAEPWSFRGHIAGALKDTDYASWNDGFREFLPMYLDGKSTVEHAKRFLMGSVGGVTARPNQTVNYVESHDDLAWIDRITQNAAHNGYFPTLRDRRMTHLMAAFVTASLGVPMFSCGMEAMRSKYGVANTYLRGDLNAIDYARVREYPTTAEYFRGLNLFRLSANGKALRAAELPPKYLRFFEAHGTNAMGVLYNAENEEACKRVFFAVNPTNAAIVLYTDVLDARHWLQVADHERVRPEGLDIARFTWKNSTLELPAMSCGIWVEQ